jgi:arylsulfatase A-like enzyme
MKTILLTLVSLLGLTSPVWAADRPNIVLILADDFGYGDARCFNPESKIPTPNIDRLAAEGMKFTDAHSGSAVCSPTRYGILTGRYAWRTHLRRGVLQPYDPPLIAGDRPTLPALLKTQGYHTACIGKWHLGWDWPQRNGEVVFDQPIAGGPTARGFDYYFGTHVPNHPPYCFIHNDRTVGQPTEMKEVRDLNGRPGPMLPGWKFDEILPTITRRAVDYIGGRAKEKEKPFFLYFPLTSPHEPIAPSAKFRGKSGINDLADFFMESDWALGEVIAALDKHQLTANTLVFFTCDNGHATYTGLKPLTDAGHKVSGPYRGFKTDIWEGGHRVPFIARWPGKIQAGAASEATICHTNLLATCLDVLGQKPPANAAEDSFSIWPVLQGKQTESPFPYVVHQAANGRLAIRQGKWKLIAGMKDEGENAATPEELYDPAADSGETTNVAAKHPAEVKTLLALLEKSIADGRSTPGEKLQNDVAVPLRIAAPAANNKKQSKK